MDVAVIILYSINTSIADALTTNVTFSLDFISLLFFELFTSAFFGYLVGKIYQAIFSIKMSEKIKAGSVLTIGFGIFLLADVIKHYTKYNFLFEFSLEPLLICMIAAFYLSNFSVYRDNIKSIIYKVGPTIYLLFFTLTGASLDINILPLVWDVALIIFFARLLSIIIGSVIGGTIAKTPVSHTKVSWMAFITQAGVGLGLAKGIADNYPAWGSTFATIIISVIVINQIVGPIMFKFSLFFVKEAHPEAKKSERGEIHSALIIGVDGISITLAEQLAAHDWKVSMATNKPIDTQMPKHDGIQVYQINDLTLHSLKEAEGKEVGTIITMLSDENNFHVCELAFEHFPNCKLVVYLKSRSNFERFKIFNASIVSTSTATISLLDHYVRSPSAVSLLLGLEEGQDIIDITISNPHLFGLPMRDLRLPEDIIIVSMHRGRHSIAVQGHTRFKVGDQLTVKGNSTSLKEIKRIFTK
jgi:Trk K+ transport system NAD-binding subunit